MDITQSQVAAIALSAAAERGFVLAGGFAIALHGIGDRPSADVDLFTSSTDRHTFAEAVDAVTTALTTAGWTVDNARTADTFARLVVTRGTDEVIVELGVDYRRHPPATMTIGPVLAFEDAAGSKMSALYGRGEVRDFIDVYAIIESGQTSRSALLALGDEREAVPMDRTILAGRLSSARRIPDSAFAEYQVDPATASQIRKMMCNWSNEIIASAAPPRPGTGAEQLRRPDCGPSL